MNINKLLPKESMKDKYFIYVRKSTRPEDRQSESIPDQIKVLNEFSKKQGYCVAETFIESRSAYKDDAREVFDSMLKLAETRGDIKGFIFRYIDRASRNLIEGGYLFKLIENGVIDEIVTPEAVFNKNNFFYYGIEILKAKSYSDDISKKVRDSISRRVEQGIPINNPFPGYMWSNDLKGRKKHIPHPTQFLLMKQLFGLFLTGNFSVAGITRKAQELGVKNAMNHSISRSRMHEILRSTYYCGRFNFKGKEYQGLHKPMITNDQHKAILQILKKSAKPNNQKRNFKLNGIITCGECGRSVYGESHIKHYKNGTSQEFRYYRCSKRNIVCTQPYISEADLEAKVSDYLSHIQMGSEYIEWAYKWLKNIQGQEIQTRDGALSELNKSLTLINKKIDNLMDEKLSGSIFTQEELDEKYRTLKIERKEVEDNIKNVGSYSDEVNELTIKTFVFADRAKYLFDNGSPEEKLKVLQTISTNLYLKDKNIWLQPQIPFLMIENAVKKLCNPDMRYELDQNVIFDIKKEEATNPLFIWRGLADDVRTYYTKCATTRSVPLALLM